MNGAPPGDTHASAVTSLSKRSRAWKNLIATVGPCLWQPALEREPYESLVRSIAYQQLHGRAAEAILKRMLALFPRSAFPSPRRLVGMDDLKLRACGFSAAKITTIKGIAAATLRGTVPSRPAAEAMSDDELIQRLIQLRGVGRWTVEMLLINSLGRPDVLPVDDFGVREGWRVMNSLPEQPSRRELAEIGKQWSPHRSVATWYLWRAAERT